MREKVIKILKEIIPDFEVNENINFIEQGMLDSFDVVNLVTALDNEFNISIDGMDILPENFTNIDSILYLLSKNGVQP